MALFRAEGMQPRVVQKVTNVLTAIAPVTSGFGICVTPAVANTLKLPGVAYRPIKATQPPTIDLTCLYRRDDESPILGAFLEVVRKFSPADIGWPRFVSQPVAVDLQAVRNCISWLTALSPSHTISTR